MEQDTSHPDDQAFIARFRRKLDSDLRSQLSVMRELRRALETGAKPESPQGRALLALTATMVMANSVVLRRSPQSADGQLQFDPIATRAKMPPQQRRHVDTLQRVYGQMLRQLEEPELRQGPLEDPNSDRFQHYQQRFNAAERTKHGQDALALFDRLTVHIQRFAPPGADLTDLASLSAETRERLRTGQFTEADAEKFQSEMHGLRLVHAIGSQPSLMRTYEDGLGLRYQDLVGAGQNANLAVETLAQKLEKRIQEFSSYIENPRAPGPVQALIERTVETCRVGVELSRELLPKTDASARARQMVRSAAARVSNGLARYVSGHSRRSISKSLAQVKVAAPLTVDQHLRYARELLGVEAQTPSESSPSQELNLMFAAASGAEGDWPAVSEHLQRFCRERIPNPVPDSAIVGGDQIVVGPVALHDRHLGEGICAHELGHHISGLFANNLTSTPSKEWYESVRACLRRPDSTDHRVEEDWADLVASLSGHFISPFWCATIAPEEFGRPEAGRLTPLKHSRDEIRAMHNRLVVAGERIPECEALFQLEASEPTAAPVMRDCRDPKAASR
jgi:hypothetical protein